MSTPTPNDGKLQQLIEKFGGWAFIAILTMGVYMYQGDKANMQESMAAVNARVTSSERAIGRLQDGKASREELKNSQEASLRELQGLRADMKDLMSTMRSDMAARLELTTRQKQ